MTPMFEIIINAIFTGIGVTIGTYIANRLLIKKLDTMIERLKTNNRK
jgi:uncharacterized protein YneF (UPF0154 family)